jgi:hypothetical protein
VEAALFEDFAEVIRCEVQAVRRAPQAIMPDHLSIEESNEHLDPEAVDELLTK